jgi:hypothetical protein
MKIVVPRCSCTSRWKWEFHIHFIHPKSKASTISCRQFMGRGRRRERNIFSISSYQSRVEWMGKSLTTNEESRWATPLSFLALSSSALLTKMKARCILPYRCWRFQSSVWGGGDRHPMLKAQKNLWVFVSNRCFLANFLRENFFRDFTGLDWFDPLDSSWNTTCSFSWFFLFVFFFGGGRWEDYRNMSSLETILHFCSSGMFFCRELIGMLLK